MGLADDIINKSKKKSLADQIISGEYQSGSVLPQLNGGNGSISQIQNEIKTLQNKAKSLNDQNSSNRKQWKKETRKKDNIFQKGLNILDDLFIGADDRYYNKKYGNNNEVSEINQQIRQKQQELDQAIINNEKSSTVEKLVLPLAAGLDQGMNGLNTTINKIGSLVPGQSMENYNSNPSFLAQKYQKVRSDTENPVLGIYQDLMYTTGNMIPAMTMPGKNLATLMTGATSFGNAYNQARQEGKTDKEATTYGLLSGSSEVLLEKILGGMSSLYGESFLGKQLGKTTDKVLGRVVKSPTVRYLISEAGSEFTEEYLQEVLEPVFRNLAFDENNEIKLVSEEALYSGFLGALNSSLMNGSKLIINQSNLKKQHQKEISNQANQNFIEENNIRLPQINTDEIKLSKVDPNINQEMNIQPNLEKLSTKQKKNSATVSNAESFKLTSETDSGTSSLYKDNISIFESQNKYKNINEAMYDYANSIKDNFNSNISIETKKNILPIDYSKQSQTTIFNKAKEMFSKIGKSVFKNNGEDIYVSNGDIKESIAKTVRNKEQKKLLAEHIEVFNNLDKIIENGALIAKGDETKGRYKYQNWNYYATPVKLNNENYIVEFDVVLREDGEKHFRLERIYSLNEATKKQVIPTEAFNYHQDNQSVSRFVEQPVSNDNNTTIPTQSQIALLLSQYNMQQNENKIPTYKDFEKEESNHSVEESNRDEEMDNIATILQSKTQNEQQKDSRLKELLTTKILDKGYYIDKIARQYKNPELSAKYDYQMQSNGIANQIIGNGRYDSKGNKIGKSLYEIFEPIENAGLVQEFSEYMYHKHNVDRMSLEGNILSNGKIEENKPIFGNSVTAEISRVKTNEFEAKYPQFEEWAKDVYDYSQADLEMLVNNQVISAEDKEFYNKRYPNYVPIVRDKDNPKVNIGIFGKRAKVNVPIKTATGGNADMIPLKDALAFRTMQTVNSALKNDFGLELYKTIYGENDANGETTTIDNRIENNEILTPKTKDKNATFTIFRNGKKVIMEISEEIYEALTPRNLYTIKPLNKINNFRRGVLTEYNPAFMITNPIKDIQDGLINSKRPIQFIKNIPEAVQQIRTKGKLYDLYMANGGGQDTYFNYDKGTQIEKRIPSKWNMPSRIINKISELNEIIEMTPRMSEFISSINAGDSLQTAMYNSQEVTTNFKRGGDWTKNLDRNGFTFLNAGVQGFQKQIRNFQESKANGIRGIVNLGLKFTFNGLVLGLLNNLIWDDDDDYEELSDYIKNNYYIIGKYSDGKFIRIPKGRVTSVLQKTFENLINTSKEQKIDIKDWQQLGDLISNNLLPSDPEENNLLSPLLQAYSNKTWYGGNLVPERLKNLPNAEQYDETTDSISIWLGKTLNISPYKINYVLDQYSGAIGDFILPYLTLQAESDSSNIIAPVIDKFTTDSILKNQNVSDLYSLSEEYTKKSNGSKATDEEVVINKYLNSTKSQMSKLYAEKRNIQSDKNLSNREKYNQAREIQKQIDELSKNTLSTYKNVKVTGNYGIVDNEEYYKNAKMEWTKVDDEEKKEIEKLEMSSIDKNKYFTVKVKSSTIKANKTLTSTEKKERISNLIINSGLEDRKMSYLYSKYYSSEAVLNSLLNANVPIKEFIKFNSQNFESDYNTKTGKTVSGSRQKKVMEYVNNLNLSVPQKALLIKMEYGSYTKYDKQIAEYVNSQNISFLDKAQILKKANFTSYDKQIINYVNSQNKTVAEKTKILEDLGFTVKNGRVY